LLNLKLVKTGSSIYLLTCHTFYIMISNRIRLFFILNIFAVLITVKVQAQAGQNLDKIVAIVGDHIVLASDINQIINEGKAQNQEVSDDAKCEIMESMLGKFLLCEQAARDSIEVSEEEVEGTMDSRVRYMISMYGSQEKMEEVVGKTVYQIKDNYRRVFKDELLAQKMRGQVMQSVKISPLEVRSYFEAIPKDSLTMYPSMVEVGQIILAPTANKEVEDYTRQQLEDIRQQVLDGKSDFETMAAIYSQDPGSKDLGGNLGIVSRDEMVPEFSGAGFKLQNNEISMPVKTKYGYHIIQMVQRMGEKAKLRHILIKPAITSIDITVCQAKLDSIRTLVTTGKISFVDAVNKFSTDDNTKATSGMLTSQQTGSSLLTMEELDPTIAIAVGNLKAGQYSEVEVFDIEGKPNSSATNNNNKECRFIFLKNINEPHMPDIGKDFNRIQQAALEEKKTKFLYNWVDGKISDFYIYIDPEYNECTNIKKWMITKTKE
jgi:peptidyl-prolyl cis-trans isomerase SurA